MSAKWKPGARAHRKRRAVTKRGPMRATGQCARTLPKSDGEAQRSAHLASKKILFDRVPSQDYMQHLRVEPKDDVVRQSELKAITKIACAPQLLTNHQAFQKLKRTGISR